jgi:hypothetical protein
VQCIFGCIAVDEENPLPQPPMRVDTKKTLTKSDEAGGMDDRIWCELMQLHTINKQKPTKKFMGRESKTTEDEIKE